MSWRRHWPFIPLFIALASYGCAGSTPDPVAPSGTATPTGPAPFGHYLLHVEGDAADLTPVSTGQALGDAAAYDATAYFTGAPCHDCVALQSISRTGAGHLALDIAIRHPWRETDSRLDLDAFDVRGVLGVHNLVTFPDTPGVMGHPLATDPNLLVNADGYTTQYGDHLTTGNATLNPFKNYFWEDDPDPLGVGAPIPNNRMAMNSDWDVQRYELDVASGPADFDFLVTVNYGQASRGPAAVGADQPTGRLHPVYWLPEFNQKEAWDLHCQVETAPDSDAGGTLSLSGSARDWQVGYSVDANYPDPAYTSGLKAASGIAGVTLEIPGIDLLSANPTTSAGTGAANDPKQWTWNFTLPAETAGAYPALLTVTDARSPAELTSTGNDYRAFQITTVILQPGGVEGTLPEAVLFSTPDPANAILRDAIIGFSGEESYDLDGNNLVEWAYDYDYDGTTFDPEDIITDPLDVPVAHTYDTVGDYTCALRVKNDAGEQSLLATLPVHITPTPVIPSPNLSWQTGTRLDEEFELAALREPSDSAICVGNDGVAHIAYLVEEEAVFLGTTIHVYHTAVSANGTVQPREEVYSKLSLETIRSHCAVGAGPAGKLGIGFAYADEVLVTNKTGSTWSEPLPVAAADLWGGENLGRCDYTINAAGQQAVIWETYYANPDL
ncbi:MAG: hypothetical protein ABI743_12400, partial [bacterium]